MEYAGAYGERRVRAYNEGLGRSPYRGRALAVVKVTFQVNGDTQSSASEKTICAIKMNFGTIDYVGERNPQPTFGKNPIVWVKYNLSAFSQ